MLVDAQSSHRFSEIEQVSRSFIGNSTSEMEVKLKLELESLFEKSIVATFFQIYKELI